MFQNDLKIFIYTCRFVSKTITISTDYNDNDDDYNEGEEEEEEVKKPHKNLITI